MLIAKKIIFIIVLFTAPYCFAEMVAEDDFEYSIARTGTAADGFVTNGPWTGVKAENATANSGARGYLHTVTSIPGYSGAFPGTNSNYVLLIEALPDTLGDQTDFYLTLGDNDEEHNEYIPADVWFQFWIYSQHYGDQLSRHRSGDKFLYVCNGTYGCSTHLWMFLTGASNWNPHVDDFPNGNPSNGEIFFKARGAEGVSTINWEGNADSIGRELMGATSNDGYVRANTWTLAKIHFDTTTSGSAKFEVWLREYGSSGWTKVNEWIAGGQQHGYNFTWTYTGDRTGHRIMKMPAVVGKVACADGECYDYWLYMDDFQMAESESDLTVYTDGPANAIQGASSSAGIN